MLDHQPPPEWVRGRAECNLDMIFDALHQIVQRDVKQFNELYDRQRQGRRFQVHENGGGCDPSFRVVLDADMDRPPQVVFRLSRSAILINGGGQIFNVRPEWDGKRCRQSVGERSYSEPWEISQLALAGFLFGPADEPLG